MTEIAEIDPVDDAPKVRILKRDIEPDLDFAAAKRFRKLAEAAGMSVTVFANLILEPATYYVGSSENHNAGDLKKPEMEMECFSLTAISPDRKFAVWAYFENKKLSHARWGGPAMDPTAPQVVTSMTITPVYDVMKGFEGVWTEEA